MRLVAGISTRSFSLPTTRKKTCVDIPTDFGFFLGTRRQTKYLLSPLPPACSTQQHGERERGKKKERESYIFNRLIFSLREGKLNTSALPPTHTHARSTHTLLFCVLWQILLFQSCVEQEKNGVREKRRGWKEKKEKRRERPHRVFLPSWCERRPPQSPCVISSPSEFRY